MLAIVVFLTGTLAACGDGKETVDPSSGGGGAGGSTSAGGGTGTTAAPEPFAEGALVCDAPPEGAQNADCCPAASLRPVPALATTVIDLSDPAAIEAGTCSQYLLEESPSRQAVALPLSVDAYPIKVVLPAVSRPDPGCLEVCPDDFMDGPHTTFGVAFITPTGEESLIGGNTGRVLALSVPPPWYVVSGGCGEACAWPCLEGYQEYGSPRSCITLGHGDFGFATSDPGAPSVEAVIDVITLDVPAPELAPGNCCLFASSP